MQQVYVPSLEVVEKHAGKCRKSLTDMEIFHQDGENSAQKMQIALQNNFWNAFNTRRD